MREMIIVMPDASNRFLGSFYTDSATTGNWEKFITEDLVRYVDRRYRTAAKAESRGIAGHSMGGYGALKIAMKHPDVFSAAYAMSACCMEWGPELAPTNAAWDRTLGLQKMEQFAAIVKDFQKDKTDSDRVGEFFAMTFMAMAAAWSPDPERGPFFVDFPVEKQESGRAWLQAVMADWSANMIIPEASQYRANLARLHGLRFDVGKQEQFPSILAGARDFSQLLKRNGIQHEFEEYEGTHMSKIGERLETVVLPFFSKVLE
jgi:S-formylglutathione hydrolase